ncbi:hypothetical protein BBJ28_00022244 [Nothophytophthora sp. Chile5]|nr:hypothetical protein BBJ28_00022244 [Nothophytophthora sp. Chile5]
MRSRNDAGADAAAMDPNQSAYHAQAQVELRELFQELACNGQVSAVELQRSLVPFTAGDVKRDLLELIVEMKRKQLRLDESGFLRVMWRKMYLSSVVDTSKSVMPRDSNTGTERGGQSQPINVSLAHVIVSIKRRSQLKQFAGYYASRGISGADHLTSPPKRGKAAAKNSSPSGRKEPSSPCSRRASNQSNPLASDAPLKSIETLRRRQSPFYDVVACVFDAEHLEMQTRTLLTRTRTARVHNCSRLYCLLFAKDAGSFILGSTFFAEKAQSDHQREKDEHNIASESIGESMTASWIGKGEQGLLMLRMEEYGPPSLDCRPSLSHL